MKNYTLIFFLAGLISIYSCKSKEDKAKDIVEKFMKQINDENVQKKDIDFSAVSSKYKDLFLKSTYFSSESWTLIAEPESETSIVVKSTGKTFNSSGEPVENHQEFAVKMKDGNWKISDSYNVIAQFLDFEIVDQDWEFYWDGHKHDILLELQNNLKLEILQPAYSSYFGDSKKGNLRLVNNSDYDIKSVNILIEHFDSKGNSVNTDHVKIYDIIRKHGYREIDWYTNDCSKCVKQIFKINFIRESN